MNENMTTKTTPTAAALPAATLDLADELAILSKVRGRLRPHRHSDQAPMKPEEVAAELTSARDFEPALVDALIAAAQRPAPIPDSAHDAEGGLRDPRATDFAALAARRGVSFESVRMAFAELDQIAAAAGRDVLLDRPGARFDSASARAPQPPSPAEREAGVLVAGMLRRGANTLLIGATHVGKTLVTHGGLVVAGVTGGEFLGRPVTARRWLVADSENNADDLFEVWTAAGLSEAQIAEHIALVDREQIAELGLSLADPAARDWLLAQARAHRAEAIVLDSLGMMAGVKLTDDQAAADLYRETLKPLAVRANAGVLLTHHETKYGRAGSDTAYQGAGQVTAQADTVLTMRQTAAITTEPEGAEGARVRTHSAVALRQAKNRPRGSGWTEYVEIAGMAAGAEDGAPLLELHIGLKGAAEVSDADRFMAALYEPTSPGELAKRLDWSRRGARFQRTADEAEEAGRMTREGSGPAARFVPTDGA